MVPILTTLLLAVPVPSSLHAPGQDTAPVSSLRPADLEVAGIREAQAGNRASALRCARHLVQTDPARAATFLKTPEVARLFYEGEEITTLEAQQIQIRAKPMAPLAPALWRDRGGRVVVEVVVDRDGLPLRVEALDGPRDLWKAAETYAVQIAIAPPASGKVGRFLMAVPFGGQAVAATTGLTYNGPEAYLEPTCRNKF